MERTIVEKLNLQKYRSIAILDKPVSVTDLTGMPEADQELKAKQYDLIFAFVLNLESLQRLLQQVIDGGHLAKGGYFYAAYPKKGNKLYSTFIHRDSLLSGVGADEDGYVKGSDVKFARMVGYNDVFTVVGFKAEPRKQAASAKPSQCVDDYIVMIPSIEADLVDEPQLLAFYASLTPGYRKDWARFVYSAVLEETREKRREEMKAVMREGFKSMDLYRRRGR